MSDNILFANNASALLAASITRHGHDYPACVRLWRELPVPNGYPVLSS